MDFHNNKIGRQIYKDNTTHRIFYISEPSHVKIERIAFSYVNNRSCLIVKKKNDPNEFPYNLQTRDLSDGEVQSKIINTNDNTVVYFAGTIAPSSYRMIRSIDSYDYSAPGCTSWGRYLGVGNCPRTIYKYEKVEIKPCYQL